MAFAAADFAGALHVRAGGALPTIASTRRAWAPVVARGRPADALPALLGSLYALCGGAHRVAARHAVAAARGQALGAEAAAATRALLRHDTLREHLRRLWLDAPRLVPSLAPPDTAAFAACAALHGGDTIDAARDWVEQHVLGQGVAGWLDAWCADPRAHVADWAADPAARRAASGATWPARWLDAVRRLAPGLPQRVRALLPHASPVELARLAASLREDAGFALAPTWRGRTAETGSWTRLADCVLANREHDCAEPWMRHAARIAEAARLVSADGASWLACGGQPTGPAEGLGYCEMARGLLIHWVRLDACGAVADCRIIAPTEWNFHPFGAAARALAALPQGGEAVDETRVRLLLAAYDPCVAVEIEAGQPATKEPIDA